jgi:DNA helicase-2/ATP-dependent DNA helicase PcrA
MQGDVEEYVRRYTPQVLRLNKTTACAGLEAMNFGIAKGLTFDRVLIFPHGKGKQWLKSGDFNHVAGSVAEMYVGVTRARHSVTFVFDDDVNVQGVARYPVAAA